jgi:hypothetical protein
MPRLQVLVAQEELGAKTGRDAHHSEKMQIGDGGFHGA